MGMRTRGEGDDSRPGEGTEPLSSELSDATIEFPPVDPSVSDVGDSEETSIDSGDQEIVDGEAEHDGTPPEEEACVGW